MIQVDEVHIENLRGIRSIFLDLGHENFSINGPNGSGKSGVVDAIEFGLRGDITRLGGEARKGLSVKLHAPHVDRRSDPETAVVKLKIHLVATGETSLLTRNVKTASKYKLEPESVAIREAVDKMAQHKEVILSRREIIKFIVIQPAQRAQAIQALLRLDRIDEIRGLLRTTNTKVTQAKNSAETDRTTAENSLKQHLDVQRLTDDEVLLAVKGHRKRLGLSELKTLDDETDLREGLVETAGKNAFAKTTAIAEIKALQSSLAVTGTATTDICTSIIEDLDLLLSDDSLLRAMQRRTFFESGLSYVDNEACCPLCGHQWADQETLAAHIRAEIETSKAAEDIKQRLDTNSAALVDQVRTLRNAIIPVIEIAKTLELADVATVLRTWAADLKTFGQGEWTTERLFESKSRIDSGWQSAPEQVDDQLGKLSEAADAQPDQSATLESQAFLITAQDRIKTFRQMRRALAPAAAKSAAASLAYQTYCDAADAELVMLYNDVQEDFGDFYRTVNADDESTFKARLESSGGKLELNVDFYGHGMFPPSAYHSEGHQDGMGVCLYLALMRRVLGDDFRFAVLDDVVMSVDSGHRKEFCRLLKEKFPDTQFVITTHDRVWAQQMRSSGLIKRKRQAEFRGWNVESGPIYDDPGDFWELIEADLANDDVNTAAARLRRNMERMAAEWAESLGAPIPYNSEGSHDLGEYFSAAVGEHGKLLKKARNAASTWGNTDDVAKIEKLQEERASALGEHLEESWMTNIAVHFNQWENLSKQDFRPVVKAAKDIAALFECSNPGCESVLRISPRKNPDSIRCECASFQLNLNSKKSS